MSRCVSFRGKSKANPVAAIEARAGPVRSRRGEFVQPGQHLIAPNIAAKLGNRPALGGPLRRPLRRPFCRPLCRPLRRPLCRPLCGPKKRGRHLGARLEHEASADGAWMRKRELRPVSHFVPKQDQIQIEETRRIAYLPIHTPATSLEALERGEERFRGLVTMRGERDRRIDEVRRTRRTVHGARTPQRRCAETLSSEATQITYRTPGDGYTVALVGSNADQNRLHMHLMHRRKRVYRSMCVRASSSCACTE